MTSPMHRRSHHQHGYGLIVVAALFTAFAVVAAAILDRTTVAADLDRDLEARQQLSRLGIAMAKYARFHDGLFPCPAQWNVVPTNVSFGAPVVNCQNTPATAGTAFQTGTATANKLLKGMVPVLSLAPYGIMPEDAFDPWGSRIMYTVNTDLTWVTPSPGGILDNDRPIVTDYITSEVVNDPRPDIMLTSYGKDRMGGYLRNQSSLAAPAITCVATVMTWPIVQNCKGTNTYIRGPQLALSTTVTSEYYDDIVSTYRYQ